MTTSFSQGSVVSDGSRNSKEGDSRNDLKHVITDFLAGASLRPPHSEVCPRCGRPMQHLNATFSVYGSDRQWKIPLPVCPCSIPVELAEPRSANKLPDQA